jgi:endonuclease G
MRKRNKRLLIALLVALILAAGAYFIPADVTPWLEKPRQAVTDVLSRTFSSVKETVSRVFEEKPQTVPAVATNGLEMPRSRTNTLVGYTGFTVSWDSTYRIPEWVAYELTEEEAFATDVSRSDTFWEDDRVKNYSKLSDYRGSGYDRGHMCPSNDQRWSEEANYDSFSLLNMVPQDHDYNAGIWLTAEKWVRNVAGKYGKVYVATGPVIKKGLQTIGSGVAVPEACWKALLVIFDGKASSIALCIPQSVAKGQISAYAMSVNELEELTGLDLFYNLPDDIEEQVESMTSTKGWQM